MVGVQRPKPSARISRRVVRASATSERIRSGTSRNQKSMRVRPDLAWAESAEEVEAKVEIRDQDGQSISAELGSLQVAKWKVGAQRPKLSARI